MASQTDEAERRVRQQRALIEQKVGDLERRVGDDLSIARERMTHHLAHLPDLVPGGSRVVEQAQQRPITTLAGSLGVGVALGLLTGGGGDDGDAPRDTRSNGRSRMGAAAGLLSGLGSSVMSPLRPYMEDMARDVMEGFADRRRQSADRAAREDSRGP